LLPFLKDRHHGARLPIFEGGEQENQNGLNRIAIIGRGYLSLREGSKITKIA
jgi:hypothetical protein